jgi:hypothetical protein
MPVILPDDFQSAWIDPKQTNSKKAQARDQTNRNTKRCGQGILVECRG